MVSLMNTFDLMILEGKTCIIDIKKPTPKRWFFFDFLFYVIFDGMLAGTTFSTGLILLRYTKIAFRSLSGKFL